MLEIYPFILDTLVALRPVAGRIARADPDLGRQLRRAQASIALNVAEGAYSRGKNRQARYHTALGSARETLACLEVAVALGHIGALEGSTQARSIESSARSCGWLVASEPVFLLPASLPLRDEQTRWNLPSRMRHFDRSLDGFPPRITSSRGVARTGEATVS